MGNGTAERQGWLTGEHAKTRAAFLVAGVVAMAAAAGAATRWVHVQDLDSATSAAAPAPAEPPMRVRIVAPAPAVRPVAHAGEVAHADVYFDLKSARLRADAVRTLQEQAARVDQDGAWAILVQGYADRQGSPEYNRQLAQRRAEAVKQFMVELGVPESALRTATVGPEGAICDEPTAECRDLNRRVHIEMRRMVRAVPAVVSPSEVFDSPATGAELPAAR